YLGIERQIPDHPFNNYGLLRILLSKESKVRAHGIEENRNYRDNPAKMTRPPLAFERLRESADIHIGGKILWIHFFGRGGKNIINVVVGQDRRVFGQIARVVFVVFSGPKLRRVYKN